MEFRGASAYDNEDFLSNYMKRLVIPWLDLSIHSIGILLSTIL
ncbi:hypothetical protein [Fredinandcohnia onubensis]|nr:hypothetical protein [Fredinandcohnia onubensis]